MVNMNRRRYLNYISTLNTLQDTSINFKKLIPTAVYNNSRPLNNKNLIGDININITLPSGFVAQNTDVPVDRSIRQEPISQVFEQQNIPATQDIPLRRVQQQVILPDISGYPAMLVDTPESRNIIFEQERLRRRLERARLLEERETRSIARRQRNAEAENRRRGEIDPDNELIVPVLPAANDPTESEIEFHRGRLQDIQGFQPQQVTTSQQMLTLGGFTSDSDSSGSNEFLRGIGYPETPTRPNTPNQFPTRLQGVGLDVIRERDYFDTDNF